ncbi:MAG: transglutaminase-like domain-containing protein, partial [Oscillospiraceae bacterium]|nr:transglutaminase-like domain-containing protein [Oscillospiraceae bacterium]
MKPTKKRRRKPRVKIPVWTSAQSHLKQTDLALFMNVAIRLALLCIATTGMGLLIVQAYEIPISHFRVGAWSFFAALFFNVVFLFLKFRYAFPAFAVLGWLYYRIADDILFDLRCFADYFLVYLDGSTLATARYAGRSIETVLYVMPLSFQEGLERSVIMLCVALALIFALSARGKFIGSILITAILVIIPAVAASKARYVPAMTLLAVGMLGLYSIWASQEQSFLKSAKPRKQRRSPFIPIIHRHGVNGAITAAIALIACILAQIIIPPEKTQSTIEFFSELSDKAIELSYEIGEKFSGGFTGMNLPALDHGGYMPSGSINIDSSLSINNPTISRTPIMNVYLENIANPVYLRNGIGAVFNPTRGSWDVNYSRGRNNMQNFPGNFYPEHEYVVFMQKTGALGYSLDSFFSRQTISVEPLVRSRPVMLPTSPYFPNYKTDSRLRASHDSILQKSSGTAPETFVWDVLYPKRRPTAELGFTDYLGRSQGDFAYALKDLENYILFSRPLTESEADLYDVPSEHEDYLLLSFNTSRPRQTFAPQFPDAGALRIYTLEYDLTAEEYLNQLKLYEEMVYEAYTETEPSETTNMIRLLVEAGILHSDSEGGNLRYHYAVPPDLHRDYTHAESLEQYLKYTYNYSLITDNNAGDNTMLGNFLFDTKSGHCALYATVMTLAMRELGLPARYVTGYVAGGPGAPLERAHDGNFVHVLRARDLHAWVEVYFQGVG